MSDTSGSTNATQEAHASPSSILGELHANCSKALAQSVQNENESMLGKSYLFLSDLEAWSFVRQGQPETLLYKTACHEYTISLLNVCQGQYRNAFKGLRLVLELCLQGVYLSANLVLCEEWMKGEQDTIWATLIDHDIGPLSHRFSKAFFPEVTSHVNNFREMARSIYSELSECIHGNIPNQILFPTMLVFNKDAFMLWHEKARIVRLIIQFSFSVRYLNTISDAEKPKVEAGLIDQLGHIEAVRAAFGGVKAV